MFQRPLPKLSSMYIVMYTSVSEVNSVPGAGVIRFVHPLQSLTVTESRRSGNSSSQFGPSDSGNESVSGQSTYGADRSSTVTSHTHVAALPASSVWISQMRCVPVPRNAEGQPVTVSAVLLSWRIRKVW